MKGFTVRNIILSALFLALGFVLPFFTMQIPSIGSMLLPMHIPVIICGFVCGAPLGMIVGFILPLLRSLIFTMPPMFPTAIAMAFELAVYGMISGYLYHKSNKKVFDIYFSLIISMIGGRIIWGLISALLYGFSGQVFGITVFIAGAFSNAIPGIILQLILIPMLIIVLQKAKLIEE
ncbi:ECF transporter S component [Thomasclavelia sp.]